MKTCLNLLIALSFALFIAGCEKLRDITPTDGTNNLTNPKPELPGDGLCLIPPGTWTEAQVVDSFSCGFITPPFGYRPPQYGNWDYKKYYLHYNPTSGDTTIFYVFETCGKLKAASNDCIYKFNTNTTCIDPSCPDDGSDCRKVDKGDCYIFECCVIA